MEKEVRTITHTYSVYWVADAEGKKHLFHDSVAAQAAEDQWKKEMAKQ
jgi:hypothetical protein